MESTVVTAFMKNLQTQMAAYGGRADYYGTGSKKVVPKEAEYSWFGNGFCN